MEQNDDKIDLRRQFHAIRQGWYYYAIALIVFVGLATYYAFHRMPQYQMTATLLIEQNSEDSPSAAKAMGGGMASLMRTFSIGGIGASSVDNEMLIVESYSLIREMVQRLGLNRTYIEKSDGQKKLLYKNSPVIVAAPDALFDTLQTALKMKIRLNGGKADVKVQAGFFGTMIAEVSGKELPVSITTPYGSFQLLKTKYYNPSDERNILATVSSNDGMADYFMKQVKVDYASKKSDGIELDLKDPSKERGCDVLNMMMALYNERRRDTKNQKAQEEIEFVNSRIASLSGELSDAEKRVERFKTSNNIVDVQSQASMLVGVDQEMQRTLLTMNTQVMMYDMVLKFLNETKNRYSMLPLTEAAGGATEMLSQYNALIMQKMTLDRSARGDNAAQRALTERIDAMRSIVKENVKRLKDNTLLSISNLSGANGKNKGILSQMPRYEREYYDLMRNKELKNDLYVFLLEKRENSMMKLASNIYPGMVIDKAYSDIKPLATKSYIALGVALLFSLLFPTVFILYRMRRKNVVENLFDLPAHMEANAVQVTEGDITSMGPLRGAILAKDKPVIYVASLSETGILADLLRSFGNIGKKVLNVKIDTTGALMNHNLLEAVKHDNSYDEVQVKNTGNGNDLLLTDDFKELLSRAGKEYNHIFVEIPDVNELKSDSHLLSGDLLVMVIRPGDVKRKQLIDMEKVMGEEVITALLNK